MDVTVGKITREGWLNAAVEALRPRFRDAGHPLPPLVHVSIGFPTGAKAESKFILGVTFALAMGDEVNEIFMSPFIKDGAVALATLIHELAHVVDDCQNGHRAPFRRIGVAAGMDSGKPMTEVHLTPVAAAEMIALCERLGPYPHGGMDGLYETLGTPRKRGTLLLPDGTPAPKVSSGPVKQTTRREKVVCLEPAGLDSAADVDNDGVPVCGYNVRVTMLWLDRGAPLCPLHARPMSMWDGSLKQYLV